MSKFAVWPALTPASVPVWLTMRTRGSEARTVISIAMFVTAFSIAAVIPLATVAPKPVVIWK